MATEVRAGITVARLRKLERLAWSSEWQHGAAAKAENWTPDQLQRAAQAVSASSLGVPGCRVRSVHSRG